MLGPGSAPLDPEQGLSRRFAKPINGAANVAPPTTWTILSANKASDCSASKGETKGCAPIVPQLFLGTPRGEQDTK